MSNVKLGGRIMAGHPRVYKKVRLSDLVLLFKRKPSTIQRWIRLGLLDPSSLTDIVEKYNNPQSLDKRMK